MRSRRCFDRVRPLTGKPLIVKLTPNATDVPGVARAAEAAGADAVSLINTLRGMALDPRTGQPWLGGVTGGVSGPAVRAIALAQVHAVAQAVEIPIVGMGGVQRGADALDLMRAGASLVAVGTESFRDPAAGLRIASELFELLANSAGEPSARPTLVHLEVRDVNILQPSCKTPCKLRVLPKPSSTML